MTLTKEMISLRIDEFTAVAKQAGVKITHQRLEIFRIIATSDTHPTADEIYRKLHKSLPMISLDTIYRTLWLLTDLGLLQTVGLPQDSIRFDANLEQHHHFRCTKCGLVRDFTNEELNSLPIPLEAKSLGHPISLHVEIRGVCESCLLKEDATGKSENKQ